MRVPMCACTGSLLTDPQDRKNAKEWYRKSPDAGDEPDEEDRKHLADVMEKE